MIESIKIRKEGEITKIFLIRPEAYNSFDLDMARQLSKISRHSFGWCKELMTDSFDTSFETQIEKERLCLSICAAHPDGQEGLKAFKEKRRPIFNVKEG